MELEAIQTHGGSAHLGGKLTDICHVMSCGMYYLNAQVSACNIAVPYTTPLSTILP